MESDRRATINKNHLDDQCQSKLNQKAGIIWSIHFNQLLSWTEIHRAVHWLMLLFLDPGRNLENPHSHRGRMQTSQCPSLLMSFLAVTQVMLFDVMPSSLVVVKIALNITALIAAMLKKYNLGGFPVLKWGLSHAAGEGRGGVNIWNERDFS